MKLGTPPVHRPVRTRVEKKGNIGIVGSQVMDRRAIEDGSRNFVIGLKEQAASEANTRSSWNSECSLRWSNFMNTNIINQFGDL